MGILNTLNKVRGKKKAAPVGSEEAEMSFLDHLEELRWHLMRSVVAIVAVGIFAFVKVTWLLDNVLLWPTKADFPLHKALCKFQETLCFDEGNIALIATSPYEQFLKSISIAFVTGFIVAFPYVLWEIWRFIKPGLHPHERKGMRGNVAVMSLLFFTGVAFSYFIITPFSVRFLSTYELSSTIANMWTIGKMVGMITQISVGGGIIFEMPILVYYLAKMGVLTHVSMKTYRRHAIVVLLILSAILTPPDVTSQVLIFMPLFFLYEISIGIARRVTKRREQELAAL